MAALPRGLPNARPWMAGPGDPKLVACRHGWRRSRRRNLCIAAMHFRHPGEGRDPGPKRQSGQAATWARRLQHSPLMLAWQQQNGFQLSLE